MTAPDPLHLRIAGWTVALHARSTDLADQLAARYAAFRAPAGAPDLVVEVSCAAAHPGAPDAGNNATLLHARLTSDGSDYVLDTPQAYGIIGPIRGRAALRFNSDDSTRHAVREVEYYLRIALALFAFTHDGLLIHCAALKRSDAVYLFVGQSGSGKSTVVALSQAAQRAMALGDDLILVRRVGDAWQAFGTPFWNPETGLHDGQGEEGPVAGIYKLIQDRAVYVEPMGRAAATAELIANCPIVNDQPALLPALIERCRALAGAVGVARLHFRKDDAFWDVVG